MSHSKASTMPLVESTPTAPLLAAPMEITDAGAKAEQPA